MEEVYLNGNYFVLYVIWSLVRAFKVLRRRMQTLTRLIPDDDLWMFSTDVIRLVYFFPKLLFRFDLTKTGPPPSSLLSSDRAVDEREIRWILANAAIQVGQVSLLLWMWAAFRRRQSTQAGDPVELGMIMRLFHPWGLFGRIYSLYLFLRPRGNASRLGKYRVAPFARILVALAMAFLFVASLFHFLGANALRLLHLIFPLIYVDTTGFLLIQMRPVYYPDMVTILKGYDQKPRFVIFSHFLFVVTISAFVLPWATWTRCFIILLSPLYSTALILRFLLVRHDPEYMFNPISYRNEPSNSSSRFCQITRLQRNNEGKFRQRIPWDSLPRTFRDAIRLAQYLGSDYLWIDSLCIIQDSLPDWNRKSVTMGDVYRNSVCNIAATDSSDSHEGCFYPRNPRILHPERLPWTPDRRDEWYLVNSGDCEERLPEARTRLGHEGPDTLDYIESLYRESWEGSPGYYWNSIVELYSRMSLSVESDRPVAIAGTLDIFRPYLGDYWAGLWQRLMSEHLLWQIKMGESRTGVPRICRRLGKLAPSWSRMSLAGDVSYDKCEVVQSKDVAITHFVGAEVLSPAHIRLCDKGSMGLGLIQLIIDYGTSRSSGFFLSFREAAVSFQKCSYPLGRYAYLSWHACDSLRLRAPLLRATSIATAANTFLVWEDPRTGIRVTVLASAELTGYGIVNFGEGVVKWQVHKDGVRNETGSRFSVFACFDVLAEELTAQEFDLMLIFHRHSAFGVEGLILQKNADASFSRLGFFFTSDDIIGLFLETERREIVLVCAS
ncbi:heterokaryon incompatibility protein-domain-containing protein [Apiospora saccharicola]|uniref:Heterokaryon incompatibility protein-domain-containing protein n=1 Tax=Apiospora saccharicola TaxID=335842 RepID=A0ABR1U5J5_9PEZI